MSKLSYWKKKASALKNLEPVKKHVCSETGDKFNFVHKVLAHEEAANRFCAARLKKKGSKREATTNEYFVALYMILECDEKGKSIRGAASVTNDEFVEEWEELITNEAFSYHLNAALKAIGESPEKKEDEEREAKKQSSKAQKEE